MTQLLLLQQILMTKDGTGYTTLASHLCVCVRACVFFLFQSSRYTSHTALQIVALAKLQLCCYFVLQASKRASEMIERSSLYCVSFFCFITPQKLRGHPYNYRIFSSKSTICMSYKKFIRIQKKKKMNRSFLNGEGVANKYMFTTSSLFVVVFCCCCLLMHLSFVSLLFYKSRRLDILLVELFIATAAAGVDDSTFSKISSSRSPQ